MSATRRMDSASSVSVRARDSRTSPMIRSSFFPIYGHLGARFSMNADTPSCAVESIILQAMA